LRQGLHARPAALLARRAKAFTAPIVLAAHGRTADARSVVAIMALGVRHGDELTVQSSGEAAEQAIDAILLGLEEASRLDSTHEPMPAEAPRAPGRVLLDGEIAGVAAVPGFAVGRATRIERREIEVNEAGAGVAHERAELARAQCALKARTDARRRRHRASRDHRRAS
jgi:phosphocarrier protein FPr/phosphocarrier protein